MNGASLGGMAAYATPDTLPAMTGRPYVKTLQRLVVAALVLTVSQAFPAPASAHGDITSSTPEAGTRVKRPPRQVRLVLAEPAAAGSSLTVTDGCGDAVSGEPARDGQNFSVVIDGGRPGRWQVRLRSISSVDGHVIKDRFAFRVAGKRDCSEEAEDPPDGEDPGDEIATSSRPPIENEDDGSSFPVVPFALGTVAVVGVALALRGPRKKS